MASPNAVFTEMVTTTMRHHKTKVVDNVSKHNGLLALIKEKGKIKTWSGGYEIAYPLSYAENSTYQRYSGADPLNIGASDVLSAAKYDPKQVAIHVTATGRELKMNNSKEAMINLKNARIDVAMATAANNMSIDLYSDGALANQIAGLANAIQNNGQGTHGGIDAATYTFWRNKVTELAGTNAGTFAGLKTGMNAEWLLQSRGVDVADLIVMTHDFYTIYEGGLQDLQRYGEAQMGKLGFEALRYKSASVIFDDNANFGTTSEKMYFMNTKYMGLMEHSDAQWTEDDEKVPVNQDMVVIPIYWMGAFCTSFRAGQGAVIDAA